jgi:DNA polymerase-3 subunit delta'
VPWSDLLGHERAVLTLRRSVSEGRLHHALLFHGPEGVGKSLAATLLIQSLMCERTGWDAAAPAGHSPAGDPCGECSTCRRIATGAHPDVVRVGLEQSSSTGKLRQEIVIDQLRELSGFLSFRPFEASRRAAIVDPADRMNPSAANAFLKTLEEPPAGTVIILVASNASSLLETIRSRCQPIAFGRLPLELIERYLRDRGAPAKDARLAAALADGAPGRALRLLEAPAQPAGGAREGAAATPLEVYRQRRDRVLGALLQAAGGPEGPGTRALRAAEALSPKDSEEFPVCFDLAEALLRDALLVASGAGQPVAGVDDAGKIRRLAELLGEQGAASAIATAERIRADFRVNINKTLAAECLMLDTATAAGPLDKKRP